MAAKTGTQRSAKCAEKRIAANEEELRLRVRPGTKQALADLMEWSGITEQAEAMTLILHHIHDLGREGSARFLAPPRHVYVIPENVARRLEIAYSREALRIGRDD